MPRFAQIAPESKIDELVATCRKHGLSMTQQRLAIYTALASTEDHPSAERIYEAVRGNFPAMSLATVYKALDTFEAIGLISKVTDLHDAARYDANTDRHHHLVCTRCQRIIDYYDDALSNLPVPLTALEGTFAVSGAIVQLNGVCGACQEQPAD